MMKVFEKHWKIYLVLLLAIQAFLLALNYASIGIDTGGDTASYVEPALEFLKTGRMQYGNGEPILFRTPGYPFFLAVIYAIFGENNIPVVILQCLMTVAIPYMLFRIVSNHAGHKAGLLAAILYILDITPYSLAVAVLTDLPFAFLLVLTLFFMDKYFCGKSIGYAYAGIILLNISMLVRPGNMYLNMILLAILLLAAILRKQPWKLFVCFALAFLVSFGGWSLRNSHYFGRAIFSSVRQESEYVFYAPCLYMQETGDTDEAARAYLKEKLDEKYPDFDSMDRMEQVDAYNDIGTAYIKQHVPGYIKMNLRGLANEMLGPNQYRIRQLPIGISGQNIIIILEMAILGIVYLLYLLNFFRNLKRWSAIDWVLLLMTLYFMVSTAVLGYSRFRMPFYPLCIIGALVSGGGLRLKARSAERKTI